MSPIRTHSISLSSTFSIVGICIVIVTLILYALFQARLFIEGPTLTIRDKLDTIQASRQITLEGTAKNITEISLNGRPIVTDKEGNFQESVILENGYTIVSIKARDRYGRETTQRREFVYTPLSLIN